MNSLIKEARILISLPVFLGMGFTVLCLTVFFSSVDLKPKVDENFFFSSDDPQFKADKMISEIFPQPPQVILGAKGEIHSAEYVARIGKVTERLSALPEVFSVQSLTRGPEDPADAFESPFWKRVLISGDGKSTFVSVFVKEVPAEVVVPKIEAVRDEFNRGDFQLMISGAPYIIELIRRNLARDLRIFSVVAFVVFGCVLLLVFRSLPILLGTLISCLNSSAITLILARLLKISIGPLTANLSTMVFVLTLSPIVFLTFNWRQLQETSAAKGSQRMREAVWLTLGGSFWSMATTVLGFVSLLFARATPLRQLGISGGIGTFVAFLAAYLIYPWFLQREDLREIEKPETKGAREKPSSFFAMRHGGIVALLFLLSLVGLTGLRKVNTDPDLLSYFKKGSELENGLEYIDKNGGSSPLKIVVVDNEKAPFNTERAYKKLWSLHEALERDPAVGSAVSLPLIMAEIKRSFFTLLLSQERLLKIMESPKFGEIAKYFVTEDRTKSLFVLRMKEKGRTVSRLEVLRRIRQLIEEQGFGPALIGGVYLLQGKLSELLTSSLISGLALLVVLFVLMGWALGRSLQISGAMLVSLSMIPVLMLGLLGHLQIPLDVISSPAANLSIGMGVDAMIYMVFFARRFSRTNPHDWENWAKARSQLYKPIACNMLVICSGFGIFLVSNFPPTQRFGLSVILGSLISTVATLFVLPWLATAKLLGKIEEGPAHVD